MQGYLQLVRTERAQTWAKEIGDQGRVLRRKITTAQIMKLQLQPDEGFMLSQIDGRISIADLISALDRPTACARSRSSPSCSASEIVE